MSRPARFPLRPGRPVVFRRPNGAWGYSCNCLDTGYLGALSSDRHNADSHAQALQQAFIHVEVHHKTPAELEVEALERLLSLPAHGEVSA